MTSAPTPPSPPASRNVGLPPAKPDLKASYQATIKTNRGDIVINLLNSKAPCTVNSFVYLASKSYFSNTQCHRLTTSGIYVLQCGDPTGTGTGGPGYKFNDENLAGATYPAATVAMANAGAEHQRQPVLPRLQEHVACRLVHAVRHDRERTERHPEGSQPQALTTGLVTAILKRRSSSRA